MLSQSNFFPSYYCIAEWAVCAEPENAMWSKENPGRTPYVDVIEMMDFIPEEADK